MTKLAGTTLSKKAMLAGDGMKVSWLDKPLSHCAHPKLCHMLELSALIRKQLMISSLSWALSLGG